LTLFDGDCRSPQQLAASISLAARGSELDAPGHRYSVNNFICEIASW
jgi:hypothetical protein